MYFLLFVASCADEAPDYDGDGYPVCYLASGSATVERCDPIDCDDTRANVYPDADPECDGGTDHDCDGTADYLQMLDCDHDGVPGAYELAHCGLASVTNSRISPEMAENCCDDIDNNCDGNVDENCEEESC